MGEFELMVRQDSTRQSSGASQSCGDGEFRLAYRADMANRTIHGRIRERREALGLSQQRLAELLEVSYQTIQQWEREPGTRADGTEIQSTAPKRARLAQVAAILGVTPEWLMTGRDGEGNVLDPTEAQMILFYRGSQTRCGRACFRS